MCCVWCSEEEEEEADPWAKDVEALNLSRSGGLPGPKRVPLFLKVLHGADTRDKRLVALKVGAAALPVLPDDSAACFLTPCSSAGQ